MEKKKDEMKKKKKNDFWPRLRRAPCHVKAKAKAKAKKKIYNHKQNIKKNDE